MSNPFDLPGPEFLKLYLLLLGLAVTASLVVRCLVTRTTAAVSTAPLDAYELAYLAGGPNRVALLAITRLLDSGAVRFAGRSLTWVARHGSPADVMHRRLMAATPPSFQAKSVKRMLRPEIEQIGQTLQSQELIARAEGRALSQVITLFVLGAVAAVGVVKIGVGVSRDRPVAFLIVLCLVTVALLILLLLGRYVTTAGRAVLRQNRQRRPRSYAKSDRSDDTAIALWGLIALSNHPDYYDLRQSMGAHASSGDSSTSSGCSSSSSSCSSGSSCGGGSGCGGCGGS